LLCRPQGLLQKGNDRIVLSVNKFCIFCLHAEYLITIKLLHFIDLKFKKCF
jgi:hypothetical protein